MAFVSRSLIVNNRHFAVAFVVASWSVSLAAAGTPRLTQLSPAGGQRGTTVEIDCIGRYLDQVREVLFYEPGITVESIKPVETAIAPNGREQPVPAGTRVRVRLKLAGDCALGPHGLRLRTSGGLTEYRRFFVSPYPTIDENEIPPRQRNHRPADAVRISANTTVHGRLNDASDVDLYRIEAKGGQRVSAEIEAARLGVDRGIPDLHLAIYDSDGKKIASADDSALYVQDPVLSVQAERDGAYFVEVRHCMYNGNGETYRLHVGTFTRPTAIYPAGGPAGHELNVQILGDPREAWNQTVRLPATSGDLPFVAVDPKDGVSAPSPNRLRVSPFPNVLEFEPNDNPESVSLGHIAQLPVAFNGIIRKPGDVDCFRFRARKGEQFKIHALANALGSPVDPVIWVKPVNGRGNATRISDSRPNQIGIPQSGGLNRDNHDPVLDFTAAADGEYILGIENERGEGGSDFVYRIEARPEDNAVYTYIVPEQENRFQPQLRQSIAVPAGNRFTVQVAIFNTNRGYNGDLELAGVNLPKGVTIHAPKLTPGMTRVPVVFEAAADAKPQAALIDLVVRPVNKTPLVSGYRQVVLMNSYANNDFYLHTTISKLALAVTERAPFRIEVEAPKSALVQNGEMPLKFKLHRESGFDGPVTVQLEWRPTGLSTGTPVTLSAEQSDGSYLLGAARNAAAGKYQVTLTAMTGGGRINYNDTANRTYVSSQPFQLTISEPHIEARIMRTSVERGKTATLVCRLNHLQPIQGKAKATLARLPRGIQLVEPTKEISAQDTEVKFTLRATSEALVGNYQGIVLDVTVDDHGQPVRQLTGYGLLRVDAERGVKKTP